METAVKACLCDRRSLGNCLFGKQETLVINIITDRVSGFRFKKAHHVIPADKKTFGKAVDVQVFGEMAVDILHQQNDLLIAGICVEVFQMMVKCRAV